MQLFRAWSRLAALTLASACQLERPPNVGEEDARMVDAPPACVADTIDCDDALGVYTDCSSTGVTEVRIECPLGCAAGQEKCLDIDPSNGLGMYFDMVGEPPDVVLRGQSTIRTEDRFGAILTDGQSVAVPWFEHNGLGVFVVHTLDIEGTVRLVVANDYALPTAILATGDITIRGTIDLSADSFDPGPTGMNLPTACFGASGLFNGNPPDRGGGGGGGAQMGGHGAAGPPFPAGGTQFASVEPLRGGCSGGPGGRNGLSVAGAGGGAIQLTSRTAIRLTEVGVIDASGGGAVFLQATTLTSGAGGGAGGAILLEAPQIVLDGPGVVISTKGGSGAGAGTGPASNGADGGIGPLPAPGGATTQTSTGGAGGTNAASPGHGAAPLSSGHEGGGGGGGVGLTAFRTAAGLIEPVNGAAVYSQTVVTRIETRTIP